MGWLRDLMREASPPWRSYDALARAALSHPDWPDEARPRARSLAAVFSRLERNLELDWLIDRPEVQHVLADLLQTAHARIARALATEVRTTDHTLGRLRLDDVPFARPLELKEESLPPGLPQLALRPAAWQRLWWHAPSGSGRSLVGRWLEARGLARFVEGWRLSDVLERAHVEEPVFIELHETRPNDIDAFAELPEPVCVAGPWPFAGSDTERAPARRVDSPDISEKIPELVGWLASRLSADGRFDPDAAVQWLTAACTAGWIDSIGTLLGLAGLIDEVGVHQVERRPLAHHAEDFVERRISDATRDSFEAKWLKAKGFDLVSGLVRRILTDNDDPWDLPRSPSQWAELLPSEFKHRVDTDWVRASLAQSANPLALRELERALRELPPAAFRAIRTLESAGLLRSTPQLSALALSPRWVGRTVLSRVEAELARGSPFEWGEALLRPHAAPGVASALADRIRDEATDPIDAVLELESEDSPAHVAALETIFRFAGLAILQGAEVSSESLEALWDAQLELIVDLDGVPHPRIAFSPEVTAREPRLSLGVWHLAAWAISESLPDSRGATHPLLRPWHNPGSPEAIDALFDAIDAAVSRAPEPSSWAIRAFELVGRLENHWLELRERRHHRLAIPTAIVEALQQGRLDSVVDRLGENPYHLTVVRALAEERGIPWGDAMRSLWNALAERGRASRLLDWNLDSELEGIWKHLPGSALRALIVNEGIEVSRLPLARLGPAAWQSAFDIGLLDRTECWRAMPETLLGQALDQKLPSGDSAAVVWQRAPELALSRLDRSLTAEHGSVLDFVAAAPDELTAEIARRIRDSASRQDASWAPSRRWLYERVGRRATGWREAYAALVELEAGRPR